MEEGANSSVWMLRARKAGIDLSGALHQDKKAIYEELDRLELPRPEVIFFPASGCESHEDEVNGFIKKHGRVFCRLNPYGKSKPRPFRTSISSLTEFRDFFRKAGVDPEAYELHLVEEGNVLYGGVVVNGDRFVAELHRGNLADLTHGRATPLSAEFDQNEGRFVFSADEGYGGREKMLLLKAAEMVKDHRGYFQFTVTDDGKILFNNVHRNDAFAKI